MEADSGRMRCERLHADIPMATCVKRQENAVKYEFKPWAGGGKFVIDPGCKNCEQGKEVKQMGKGHLAAAMKDAVAEIETEAKPTKKRGRPPGSKNKGGRPRKPEADKVYAKPDDPRTCKLCGVEKKARDFYKKTRTADGYERTCKACRLEDQRERDARNREKVGRNPEPAAATTPSPSTGEGWGGGEEKRCSICGIEKPLSQFHRRRNAPDGHRAQCKTCRNNEESARVMDFKGRIIVDFSMAPDLLKQVRTLAAKEFRNPGQQILQLLATHNRIGEEGQTDGQ